MEVGDHVGEVTRLGGYGNPVSLSHILLPGWPSNRPDLTRKELRFIQPA